MKTKNLKYEITDISHEKYPFLHRIRALQDIGADVKAGDLGGFVESESNLSASPDDSAWIYDDAIAAGNSFVDLGACLRDKAVVCDDAYVSQKAVLSGSARAEDSSYVRGGVLSGKARVSGKSMILPSQETRALPVINGTCAIYGTVLGNVRLTGSTVILGDEVISNHTKDTLVIDGAARFVLRDPERDDLLPRWPFQHMEKQKKKNRGGLSR